MESHDLLYNIIQFQLELKVAMMPLSYFIWIKKWIFLQFDFGSVIIEASHWDVRKCYRTNVSGNYRIYFCNLSSDLRIRKKTLILLDSNQWPHRQVLIFLSTLQKFFICFVVNFSVINNFQILSRHKIKADVEKYRGVIWPDPGRLR